MDVEKTRGGGYHLSTTKYFLNGCKQDIDIKLPSNLFIQDSFYPMVGNVTATIVTFLDTWKVISRITVMNSGTPHMGFRIREVYYGDATPTFALVMKNGKRLWVEPKWSTPRGSEQKAKAYKELVEATSIYQALEETFNEILYLLNRAALKGEEWLKNYARRH